MNVLLVDDDPLSLLAVETVLRTWGHNVNTAMDGNEAWERLQGPELPDIVILDWMMPRMDGLELTERIRSRAERPYIYVIMVTGRSNPRDLLVGFDSGVDDFLRKPLDLDKLQVRLRAAERIVDLQNELIESREALRLQAMQDPLTRILNHGAIVNVLSQEMDRSSREGQPLSLILGDLDEFKEVNDTHGHLAGDQVLIEVARRIRNCLRSYDAVGRCGGEEFLAVLPNTDAGQAARLAERIRVAISEEPFRVGADTVRLTLSQGVCSWSPSESAPTDSLIRIADQALYQVKNNGRDGVAALEFRSAPR
jgi:two-component system, cell cycle response regulator